MQAYSSTLLQFIFKFQLVYFPYFYDDKVQKKCTNLVHSCNQMVHSYFARYSPNRKILAKNARYLPFLSDICLYLPKSHNWGGRGRKFKSCHSDQKTGDVKSPVFFSFYGTFLKLEVAKSGSVSLSETRGNRPRKHGWYKIWYIDSKRTFHKVSRGHA